jgi:hypothetical protein
MNEIPPQIVKERTMFSLLLKMSPVRKIAIPESSG